MFWFGLLLVYVIGLIIYFIYFKRIKLRNFCFIDGTLGSGKTFLTIGLGIKQYKANVRQVKFRNFFKRLLKKELDEIPLLYSTLKLRGIPYVLLTKDLIYRQNFRFAYKSVVIIDDVSLMADQMTYKDKEFNERMSEFIKLFRHQTKGGYLITNSQSVADLHYSLKYAMSDYIYIHSRTSVLRLFSIMRLEERIYSADNSSVQIKDEDIEKDLKVLCLMNKYFKYYDTYCYSVFTDMLPVYNEIDYHEKKQDLKNDILISFKEYNYLYDNLRKYNELMEKEKEKCMITNDSEKN